MAVYELCKLSSTTYDVLPGGGERRSIERSQRCENSAELFRELKSNRDWVYGVGSLIVDVRTDQVIAHTDDYKSVLAEERYDWRDRKLTVKPSIGKLRKAYEERMALQGGEDES